MGGNPLASDIATANAALAMIGMPVLPDGATVGLFSVSAPMMVRVEAAPSETGDTVLEVYDADGTLMVTDDDSGGGFSSRAELELPEGEYCLLTRGFAGAGVTADLQVSRLDQPALTVGLAGGFSGTEGRAPFVGIQPCFADTDAAALGTGPLDAVLAQGGATATNTVAATPYYRFTLSSPQSLTIRAENPQADPYIYIFDAAGNLIDENDDYESLNSRIDFTMPLAAGSYCIGMRALSNPNLPVTIRVAGFDADAMAAEQYANGETPPPADGSVYPVTQLGALPSTSVRDTRVIGGQAAWFHITVETPGLLLVTADEVTDSDPMVALFDARGRLIARNDDANESLNSEMVARLEPGSYMLAVQQYSTSYQGVIRLGLQRFVPAP
jgi:hypothetical protein